MCFAYFGFAGEECEDVAGVVGVCVEYGSGGVLGAGLWCGVVEVVYLYGVLLGVGLYEWGVELLADCGGVDCGGH